MDIAQLGIEVKQTGVVAANRQLEKLVEVGNKLQSVTPKIKSALDSISNDKAYNASLELKDVVASLNQFREATKNIKDFNINSGSLANLATAAERLSANNSGLAQAVEHLKAMRAEMEGMKGLGLSRSLPSVSPTSSGGRKASGSTAEVTATDELTAAQKRLVAQLEREAMAIGKTRSEYLAMLTEKRGVSAQTKEYIDKIRQAEQGTQKWTMSTRAHNAAMRMIPAQMTDIVTQISGGQSPFLVAIQQGGQLRDMFHGFGPMFQALGKFFTPMKLGIMGVVAAVGTLGYAFYEAGQQEKGFRNALLLSGNIIGKTTDEMMQLQNSLQGIAGESAAAEALTKIASKGNFTAESVDDIAKAALRMQRIFGISTEETINTFSKLQDAPLKTLEEVNKKMNNINPTIMEQVRLLERQGKTADAAAVATKAFGDSLSGISDQAVANLGYIETGWLKVKDAIIWAKNAMLGWGKSIPKPDQIKANEVAIASLQKERNARAGYQGEDNLQAIADIDTQIEALTKKNQLLQDSVKSETAAAAAAKQTADINRDGGEAFAAQEKVIQSSLKGRKKLEQEIQQIKSKTAKGIEAYQPLADKGDANAIAKIAELRKGEASAIAAINSKDKEAKKVTNKYDEMSLDLAKGIAKEKAKIAVLQNGVNAEEGSNLAQVEVMLEMQKQAKQFDEKKAQKLREQAALLDKLQLAYKTEAEHKSRMLDYSKQLVAIDADIASYAAYNEKAKFNKADEFASSQKGKNLQLDSQSAFIKEMAALQSIDQKSITADAAEYVATSRDAVVVLRNQASLIGLTSQESEKQNLILESQVETEKRIRQYKGDQAAITQVEIAAQEKLAAQLDIIESKRSLARDMTASSRIALLEYEDDAKNVGTSVASWWKSSFDSMNDALSTFCTTGKLNFRSLAASIISDMVKIQVKASTSGLAGMLAGLFGSGTSGLSVSSGVQGSYATTGVISGGGAGWGTTAFPSANGNAFTGNGVSKFANGGAFTNSIVSSPTFFKFANGGKFTTGLMGEAGPEAVVPLARMSNGKLGIASSGSSGAVQNNVSVNVNVAKDSSTSSSTTSDSENAKQLGTLISNRVKEIILQEKRPGGLLTK